jgi:hypothetical protein
MVKALVARRNGLMDGDLGALVDVIRVLLGIVRALLGGPATER